MIENYHIPSNFTVRFYLVFRFNVNPGMSLLHQACRGHLHVIKYLVGHGCDPSLRDVRGVTPLHCSCEHGKLDITRYLMETHGCLSSLDDLDNTPLHLACKNGHLDTVLYLVTQAKCDTKYINKYGKTYLHAASSSGSFEVVKFLSDEQGCQIQQDIHGNSPLHFAASSGELSTVMGDFKNCNPEIKDQYGRTPLHFASQKGHLQIVKHRSFEQGRERFHSIGVG